MEESLAKPTVEAVAKAAADNAATSINIQYIQRDILEIKQNLRDSSTKMDAAVKNITDRDDAYVKKEDFVFWRNLLVASMLGTIFMSVVLTFLSKLLSK